MSSTIFLKDSFIEDTVLTSNLNIHNITKIEDFVEQKIENKINQLLKTLPDNYIREEKPIYNFTINELYKGTIQTLIDIINDIIALIADKDFITNQMYRERFLNIFLDNKRRIFIGIILVFFSFILYFIDGASA